MGRKKRLGVIIAAGALVAGAALASCARQHRPWSIPGPNVASEDAGEAPRCAPGLDPIEGGGCFASLRRKTSSSALLVYLHGLHAPDTEGEELDRQARVARLATARGYSVLALRGKQGQCTDPRRASTWCWPSNERNASDGPAFVARWRTALDAARRRTKVERRVLLGYSNGGYFAALIASRALAAFDAITIVHAGPVSPMAPRGPKPPILLVDADDDPAGPELAKLKGELMQYAWPHDRVAREGGHALTDWDVTMALAFFDRVKTERLPLAPPLAPARPPRPHDAGPSDVALPPDFELDGPGPVP